jgi:hypothetical protein
MSGVGNVTEYSVLNVSHITMFITICVSLKYMLRG